MRFELCPRCRCTTAFERHESDAWRCVNCSICVRQFQTTLAEYDAAGWSE